MWLIPFALPRCASASAESPLIIDGTKAGSSQTLITLEPGPSHMENPQGGGIIEDFAGTASPASYDPGHDFSVVAMATNNFAARLQHEV
uniref:Uncharacterized protein n=1 Tax=Oryza meridionalis TaxID=40149 RepID=A0A0E0ETH2_9ORYZ